MPTNPLRVGIVGAGGIARTHARVLTARLDAADLVAACDVSAETLERFAADFDVPGRYLDLQDMLDGEELDIALICNWNVDHAKTMIQIAQSRRVRAILCEKPFAMNADQAEEMVAAAAANEVLLAEAFKFRHHPMHLKAKAMVDEGAIGEVFSIRSILTSSWGADPADRTPDSDWRFNKAKGGGSINAMGCYCLAQIRFIYGTEPMRVFAQAQMGFEVDDRATVLLVFPDDRIAQFTVAYYAAQSQGVDINGSAGSLHMDKPWNNSDEATSLEYQTAENTKSIAFEPLLQYTNQLQHLCDVLTTDIPHRIPPQDSIQQMKALDAIARSMATGQAVDV